MTIIDVDILPVMSVKDAVYETGLDESEFSEAGLYRVLFGSRGEIEEVEFLGDAEVFEIPTMEEVIAMLIDQSMNENDARDMVEEFYSHCLEDRGYEFGYTEEGYDCYMRIA